MRISNSELRNLFFHAANCAALAGEDRGQGLRCSDLEKRAQETLDAARAMMRVLVEKGKYSPQAFRGCPGSGCRERWLAEFKD